MEECKDSIMFQNKNKKLLIYGKWSALMLSLITLLTLIFAMIAIPISGANAPSTGGATYPYLNTLSQFPRDFIWQYIALFQITLFTIFSLITKLNLKEENEPFSSISLAFSLFASLILLVTYYTQVMVIPGSLANNEKEGLALLIQYNPHGLFIALEELGYILMAASLAFLIPVFNGKSKSIFAVRTILIISSIIAVISFIIILVLYGINKQDRFEVVIISTEWLCLIVTGFVISRIYDREIKKLT